MILKITSPSEKQIVRTQSEDLKSCHSSMAILMSARRKINNSGDGIGSFLWDHLLVARFKLRKNCHTYLLSTFRFEPKRTPPWQPFIESFIAIVHSRALMASGKKLEHNFTI